MKVLLSCKPVMGCPKLTYQTNLKPVHKARVAGFTREAGGSRQNLKKGVETGNYYYGASSRRDWVQASRRRSGALARPSPAFWRGYYDPKVSVWLSVDRLASKYPHSTPYAFVGNNSIVFVDPNGDSLDIALNGHTYDQLLSIIGEDHRDRVSHDENGRVSFDLDGLDKDNLRSIDKGLFLVNEITTSDKKYFFEVADLTNLGGQNNYPLLLDGNGVVNASNGGKDGSGGYTHRPKDGFDGQVGISASGSFVDTRNGVRDVRSSTIFHELYENFLRTDSGMDFLPSSRGGNDPFGAHGRAVNFESRGRGFGNPSPGSASYNRPRNALERYKNIIRK